MKSNIRDKRTHLYHVASQQQGYFTAKQAFQVGYSHRVQSYHKSKGNWKEIDRGIFRLTEYPPMPHEDLVRWSLWSANRKGTPQAVVSHDTALSVHELSDIMPGKIHLTVPPSFKKKTPKCCILHKKLLRPTDIEEREGFRMTTPLATIVDVADSSFPIEQLEKAIRDAFRKGILIPAKIVQAAMPANAKERIRIVMENIKKYPVF
jgi:predicted transcriptional regulator of viral defense system